MFWSPIIAIYRWCYDPKMKLLVVPILADTKAVNAWPCNKTSVNCSKTFAFFQLNVSLLVVALIMHLMKFQWIMLINAWISVEKGGTVNFPHIQVLTNRALYISHVIMITLIHQNHNSWLQNGIVNPKK